MADTVESLGRRLRMAHKRVQRRMEDVDVAKADLLDVVRAAVDEGMSLSQIADALKLSKSRAQQLVRQSDGRGRYR